MFNLEEGMKIKLSTGSGIYEGIFSGVSYDCLPRSLTLEFLIYLKTERGSITLSMKSITNCEPS